MAKTRGGHGPSNLVLGARLDAQSAIRREQAKPPQWVLDAAADRAMTGGFRTSRRHQCMRCFQQRTVSGACGC